ncbi:MAG: hypothetical protein ACI83O_000351 [Patescibacteria group bacterium]|jgi:hypothetical protein
MLNHIEERMSNLEEKVANISELNDLVGKGKTSQVDIESSLNQYEMMCQLYALSQVRDIFLGEEESQETKGYAKSITDFHQSYAQISCRSYCLKYNPIISSVDQIK